MNNINNNIVTINNIMATSSPAFDDRPSSTATAAAAAIDDNDNHANANTNTITVSSFSLATNAEHLDRLEASEQITDIASFQDIDLPPPESEDHATDIHYGTNGNGNNGNHNGGGIDNVVGVRRAKRFYYCLPMMQQYKYVIFGCLSVFILLIVATSFTATSARNAKQQAKIIAQQEIMANQQNNNAHNPNPHHPTIISDAPPSPSTTTTTTQDQHDETLGDVVESDETDGTQPPRETPFPTTAFHYDQQASSNHHAPSPSLSSSGSSSSSSSSSSSNNKPKWFTTNHEQYKSILMSHQTYGEELHSHSIARLFCQALDMLLCSYEMYCPNGIGKFPYEGPHDGSHLGWDASQAEQWAPYDNTDNSNADERVDWVQVGTVPEYEDGTYDNGYGRCYSYLEWSNNSKGGGVMDIEDTIETAHRRWILCCSNL